MLHHHRRNEAFGRGCHSWQTRLLQLCACRSAVVNNAPLQRMQDAAARLVLGLSPRDHVSPAFTKLHWLPIHYRIQFKLALLMHMAHIGQSPAYILSSTPFYQSRAVTQSFILHCYYWFYHTRSRTKIGERAFSVYVEFSPWVS